MDKIIVSREMIPQATHTKVIKVGDNEVVVNEHISYYQKQLMATQYVAYVNTKDDDSFSVYDSYKSTLIQLVLVCKYYTNISVENVQSQNDLYNIFDWVTFNNIYDQIMGYVADDYGCVKNIIGDMEYAIQETYKNKNSIGVSVQKTFGSLFGDEDFFDAIAQTSGVNNQMIELLKAYKNSNKNVTSPDVKKELMTNTGVVVDISKKK